MQYLARLPLVALVATLLAPAVLGQALTNQDNCANSGVDVRAGSGIYAFDTTNATTGTQGQNESICLAFGTTGVERDIWFTYSATQTGWATLNTCDSNGSLGDTKVVVYPSGSACPTTGTSIACSDDACGLLGSLDFAIQAGQSYIVQLGAFPSGGGGSGTIEVFEAAPRAPNIVGHYKLDESSGTIAMDSSGNGNDGTYAGGYTLGQPGAAAGTATSVAFNGTTGRAAVPDSPTLGALRNDLSVTAWVRPAALSGGRTVFGNSFAWSFGLEGNQTRFSNGNTLYVGGPALPANAWTHVAVVLNGANDATFYVGGAQTATVGGQTLASSPAPNWFLASLSTTSELWNGRLDDVQVYSGALSAADVSSLFQNPGSIITQAMPIGMPYCSPAFPNSTGFPAAITAAGSVAVAANDVTLTASSMPPGQFGYFLAGQTQGFFNPPGSSGIICLSGNIGRYNQIANIIQGPTGSIELNLAAIPVNPTQAVAPGDTWYFQCWFRDNTPALTSNFTDGVVIVFQ